MSTESFTAQQQADEVLGTYQERRDHIDILASKPVGKGGVDESDIRRRRERLKVLEAAYLTLKGLAATGAERGAA
ncbi:hypothetical protein ABLE91_05655 [Aquabacter sp. CN5-332]|uniref:hypothetical protein n=1 Tax=Aquabacter sp. CN5-332 TaxID=3156608 RepID=UPI0032B42653